MSRIHEQLQQIKEYFIKTTIVMNRIEDSDRILISQFYYYFGTLKEQSSKEEAIQQYLLSLCLQ